MIYFKKVYLSASEMQNMEKALRKVSLKRTSPPDFTSGVTNIGTDKLFLGFERKRDVKFTRLRSSFEQFFPKIIISIPRQQIDREYKFRYSIISALAFFILAFVFLSVLSGVLIYHGDYSVILVPFILLGGFILLTFLELKIINSRINKAIRLYTTNDIDVKT
jgi:hypothetical protein